MSDREEGWAFPGQARKAHWMLADGRSLCGGWGFYRGPVEQSNDDSPDNCQACKKRLAAFTPTRRHQMSDLQYAPMPPEDLSPRANARQAWQDGYHEAAQIWANPNIEAAAGKFMDCDSALATDLTGWDRKLWAAEQAIAAALTPQGDTNGV